MTLPSLDSASSGSLSSPSNSSKVPIVDNNGGDDDGATSDEFEEVVEKYGELSPPYIWPLLSSQ